MLSRKIQIIIAVLIIVFSIPFVFVYFSYVLPYKYYKKINNVDVEILYGWSVEPRYDKRKTSYVFSLNTKDSVEFGSKPVQFYNVTNDDIKFSKGKSYNSFKGEMGLENQEQVKQRLTIILKSFKATGANRLISDLYYPNVMYFTYGRRIVICLKYIPLTIETGTHSDLIKDCKRINNFWYYKVHF
jgi:hypothetical protein